jgi:nitroreductase
VIEDCLRTALTAPSGANLQPFHFIVVTDPDVKGQIRRAAEEVEQQFYENLATPAWLQSLAPLGTSASKPFLEAAPVLIGVFVKRFRLLQSGAKQRNPYAIHSAGLAVGFLVAAIHHAGLACLVYTPSRIRFLGEILGRPAGEQALLLLVVGYPADGVTVPNISRQGLAELVTFV